MAEESSFQQSFRATLATTDSPNRLHLLGGCLALPQIVFCTTLALSLQIVF